MDEISDDLVGQLAGGRHLQVGVGVLEGLDQHRLIGSPRHHDGAPRPAPLDSLPGVELQLPHQHSRAGGLRRVTLIAALRQHGTNLLLEEVDRVSTGFLGGSEQAEGDYE